MTTLVGIQGPDFVVLAADSQITDNDQRVISTQTPKIIHVGKYLLGVTGDSRPGDILTYNWKPPVYKGTNPVEWMGKRIIPSNSYKSLLMAKVVSERAVKIASVLDINTCPPIQIVTQQRGWEE